MRTLGLEDIEGLAHGESIPRFVGRIDKVWDQKDGEGEYGPWYLQNIVVLMDGGEKMQVTWTGEDEFDPDEWEGKTVAFECGENKQGKLVGVIRDVRHGKDGKIYKGVKVTPAGKIKVIESEDGEQARPKKKAASENGKQDQAKQPSDQEKVLEHAKQARRVFSVAWGEAGGVIGEIVKRNDLEELSIAALYDLHLRIAQGFSIEINKMIRKERF
jgi:hypothetical protein